MNRSLNRWNKARLTLLSFLAYFVMSGGLAPIGIVIGPLSNFFQISITDAAAIFAWLTMGILIGAFVALFVLERASLRWVMIVLYSTIALSFVVIFFNTNLLVVKIALGCVGASCGVGLAGAATVISQLYQADRRASMLVITDGFFSLAGIVCSWLAIFLLAKGFLWGSSYALVTIVSILVVLLALLSRFPHTVKDENQKLAAVEKHWSAAGKWPLPICL